MLDQAASSMPLRPQRPQRLAGLDHTLAWLRDPVGFLDRCQLKHPADIVETRLLLVPTLWIFTPDAAVKLGQDHRFGALDPLCPLQRLLQFGARRVPGLHIVALQTRHAFVWRGWQLGAGRTMLVAPASRAP